MYRYPKDDLASSYTFYQDAYTEGLTTETPPSRRLKELLVSNFAGSDKDLSHNIAIVDRYAGKGKLLDYGCSWGYGVYQFRRAGWDAIGFEVSKGRAEYGRSVLGQDILDSHRELDAMPAASFDIIYASHVLEHLPELDSAFATFRRLLKPSGTVLVFVPNAGGEKARRLGVRWGPMIGEKHTLALDASFFARNLPPYGFSVSFTSSPHVAPPIERGPDPWDIPSLPGDELLVIARPANA